LPKAFQPLAAICLDHDKTKEKFVTKMEEAEFLEDWEEVFLLISRYPQTSTKRWIEENEKEVFDWYVSDDKTIRLTEELKIGSI
jgi:hypothetical protein